MAAMQFRIKHRALLLALAPTVVTGVLLTIHFMHGYSTLGQMEILGTGLNPELEAESVKLYSYAVFLKAILIFLFGLSVGVLLAYRMSRTLTKMMLEIAKVISKIRKGELNARVQVSSYSDLNSLAVSINAMAEILENDHNELQHKINQATFSLRRTLETIEVQNIELEMSRKAAEHANKIKSEFLADMSHEIRTPLNGVIGFIHLLQKTELNQKQQEYLCTIQKCANNLLAILNDILDFSKMEAGKLRIERSTMDVRECVDETLNLLLPHAQEKNIALIPLIYSDVPRHVLSDPLRIKQIVTNLVSNAIKFTEHGSVIVRVMFEHESFSEPSIRIHVTDTGIGLSVEEQKILFHAFNQIKTETTHKLGGTGLGLVICKKLVEQLGGTIGVESELQQGSTFWFTFQIAPVLEALEPTLLAEPLVLLPPTDPLPLPCSILAVDDNPENLKLIRILLEEMGAEVATANSGKTAIAAVRQRVFNLILMDIRMPNLNGVETAHIIRTIEAEYQRNAAPIIALTAHTVGNEKRFLFENGINDYLEKPIGEIALRNMIEKWIELQPQSTPEIQNDAAAIDWVLAKKLAGGKMELAYELFEKLKSILSFEKECINQDYQTRNWQILRERIHKLHGACCYCGVPKLKNCVKILETAATSCEPDMIEPCLEAFNLAVEAVLREAEQVELFQNKE